MVKRITGPDGYERTAEAEARINLSAVEVLGDAAGTDLMNYLKSITINRACGPEVSDAALRHLEGQRFIVGLLSQRIALGHKEKTNAKPDPKPRPGS